jgi:hypothetical protein
MNRLKKLQKTYRVAPWLDDLLKRIAKETCESEASVIEHCVLLQAIYFIQVHKLVKRLSRGDDVPKDVYDLVRRSRKEARDRWAKENGLGQDDLS